ncbi:SusC/RagA family TonB-linked outer membrane protein [Dyadobacter arcticus]|uniref:TonB-linked SusC/RagA family outer membrane protein n=1 Tax=Dyadobacter arcticus TaxID=1078754 RepID=A0ABX0UJN6_9BACT|nr:TonB-dependent receptor [Dyadobacter arcticus]NIJ51910.1 TonB-linked SusC/RagA family outer membrane protein [Dyadobacter arcticus]
MRKLYLFYCRTLICCSLLFILSNAAFGQERKVTGRILDGSNSGIPGATILVKGTQIGSNTDENGNYSINVNSESSILVFSFVGFQTQEVPIGNQSIVNVTLVEDVNALEEVIVTGYTSEKKKDIIGSVSVVNTKTTLQQPSSNLGNMLQGRASGVTVSGTGAPGGAAKVRIRGFTSFGNNDPLYIIDGVPTDNANALNPQDVESIQVLKDPVSASIYGSRAANGVIVVTTRQGGTKTEISYDGYYGIQALPKRAYPSMINTQQYYEYLQKAAEGAGIPFKSNVFQNGIPKYLVTNMNVNQNPGDATNPNFDKYNYDPYSYDKTYQIAELSQGTDWFHEITRNAPVQSHQVTATGGSEKGSYALGVNYFGSDGIFKETNFNRVTVRANTRFKPKKWLTVGQNLQVAFARSSGSSGNPLDLGGGLDFAGEGSPWYNSYRVPPFIPVRDIQGNFAGTSLGEAGSNLTSPVVLARNKDNKFSGLTLLGNIYAQIEVIKNVTLSSSFGIDQRFGNGYNFNFITPEKAEPIRNNAFSEFFFRGGSWTWTNSLQYKLEINENNSLKLFAATESIFDQFRSISGNRTDYDFNDPSFWSLNTGKNLPQNNGSPSTPRTLYSIFGKVEYQLNNRYLFSGTLRRDASSVFGPESRVGIFPAVGLGWRISEEGFLKSISAINDLKIRAGWGQLGSQRNVGSSNAYSFYGATLTGTAYDINGTNGLPVIGYRPTVIGNPSTKWEAAEMVNVGIDGSLWGGRLDFSVEYFNNTTKDLLVGRQPNGLEPTVGQPQINVGTMSNKGVDAQLSTKGKITKDLSFDIGLTFTHYVNEAIKIDADGSSALLFGAGRLGNIQKVEGGRPLASFWGWQVDGIFQTQAEVDAHAAMSYKRVGSWKLRDINNDGTINGDDQTYIGNPIPKFQMGTDISLKFKDFDFQTFLFWNYGNDLYNYTKWSTHLRGFVGGYSTDVLTDSWTPTNTGASLPILNANDTYSGAISTSFYVEDGSFLRARQMQIGYTLPAGLLKKIGVGRARIYLQGQNVFTITKYSGPDPDIGILGNELQMGVDQFRTPAPRTIIFGVNLGL